MNIKNCGAANCFDYIALRARTQFHGHSRFNYVASHISNAANSVIRCICKKVFNTKKIFSSLHLKVLFLFMLTSLRSMSQMLFRGNLDFARCLCDRDHNGYLSHFWADASTLEAIHSLEWYQCNQCNQCKNCCQADNGFEESQGSLALAIGIWRIEIWAEHIQHIIMCIMVLFICSWPKQKSPFFWGVIGIALV